MRMFGNTIQRCAQPRTVMKMRCVSARVAWRITWRQRSRWRDRLPKFSAIAAQIAAKSRNAIGPLRDAASQSNGAMHFACAEKQNGATAARPVAPSVGTRKVRIFGSQSAIRNRVRFLPSHAGARPRPLQVSPVFGLRYFGGNVRFGFALGAPSGRKPSSSGVMSNSSIFALISAIASAIAFSRSLSIFAEAFRVARIVAGRSPYRWDSLRVIHEK